MGKMQTFTRANTWERAMNDFFFFMYVLLQNNDVDEDFSKTTTQL